MSHPLPDPRPLPKAAEALASACYAIESGHPDVAAVWVAIATELRLGATKPLLDRALDRLTLHDVEGIVCAHGQIAVRRKGGPGSWFLHTNDGSNCDDPRPETEYARRLSVCQLEPDPPAAGRDTDDAAQTHVLDMSRLRPHLTEGLAETAVIDVGGLWCRHCGQAIYAASGVVSLDGGVHTTEWRHDLTDQRVCPGPLRNAAGEETHHPAHTFAEPATRGVPSQVPQ